MIAAWLYDGESAVRHEIDVERQGAEFLLRFADGDLVALAPASLTHLESRPGCRIYGRSDIRGWRLGLPDDPPADIAALLPRPQRYGRWIDRIGLAPAVAIAVAISAGVLFAGSRLPVWLAPHIPLEWEKRYGDALVGDYGGKFCKGRGGQEALDKLTARLSGGKALNVRVVDIDLVNAAALPGGNIVLFDELLTESDSPDEVAGVLAHEIAHIERRHVTQAMIRELGLGLVVTALGGTTGGNIESVLATSHTRGAEREADADAIAKLRRANISPLPTAGFFARMAKDEAKLGRIADGLSYVSTHPMSSEREKRFRESAGKGRKYAAALSRDEWEALFNICAHDPARNRGVAIPEPPQD